jgi:hypothetical protein
MESQQKVSMSTDLEVAIITSFCINMQSILVVNKKEGTGSSTFDWFKSYLKDNSVWDPAGSKSGVLALILRRASKLQEVSRQKVCCC